VQISSPSFLRYGANGNHVVKHVQPSTVFVNNSFFGSDPAPGVPKTVERLVDQQQQTYGAPTQQQAPYGQPQQFQQQQQFGASKQWQEIGREGQEVLVPRRGVIRYGANGNYVARHVEAEMFQASNGFFGTDPAPGVPKVVELLSEFAQWTYIGREDENVQISSPSFLRYGANGNHVVKHVQPSTVFVNNSFFGRDPAPGVPKTVERLVE